MESHQIIVCVDGLIGVGKSTMIQRLKKDYNCFEEPLEKFTLLSNLYENPEKYGKAFQFQVLLAQFDQYQAFKNIPGLVIVERCPWTSRNIFAKLILDDKSMNVYDEFYNNLYNSSYNVDHFIYLKTDVKQAYERIRSRARFAESNLTLTYLEKLQTQYENTIGKVRNRTDIDASKSTEDVEKDIRNVLQLIKKNVLFNNFKNV